MFRKQYGAAAIVAGALVAAGLSATVNAAEPESQNTPAARSKQAKVLGKVLVTAQRREEQASEVPLALSVVGGDQLENSPQVVRANDVVQFVPNAHAAQPHGPSRARWFVRGIGTNNTGNNTINPIGIYYDDVYFANISSIGFPLFDLDHVEVLNGPQGTLWGKNSNGGAINYVSKAPTFRNEGRIRLGFGSDDEKLVEGAVNGALYSDVVAGRFAFYSDDVEGWIHNPVTHEDFASTREVATRSQVLIQPDDELRITLNFHTREFRGQTQGSHYQHSTHTPLTAGTPTQQAFLSVYPNGLPESDADETFEVGSQPEEIEAKGGNIKVAWDSGIGTFTSITAYEDNVFTSYGGSAAIPETSVHYNNGTPFGLSYGISDSKQVSEELRLASAGDTQLTWLAGLYAFKGELDNRNVTANYIRGGDSTTQGNAWGTGPQFTDTRYLQKSESYAVFGNLGYTFTDDFKISGGVRWSHEKISIDWDYSAANTAGTFASYIPNLPQTQFWLYKRRDLAYADDDSQSSDSWTYDITPEYRLNDNLRTYLRFAHGVLPGGYTNTSYLTVPGESFKANQLFALDEEEIDAWETGLKTNWLDHKLTADFTAFYYDYENLVVNVPTVLDPANPTITSVLFRNAGAARIKGLELRSEALPAEGWRVGGTIGVLRTEYTEDTGNTATILGAQAPRSPKTTASIFTSYEQILPLGGSFVYALDGKWSDKYYYYPTISAQKHDPDPLLAQDPFAVFNGHITWHVDDNDRLALQLSVLNLFDKEYTNHGLPISNGSGQRLAGRPRSFLISVNANF